jgi:hypothetical protein
MHFRFGKIRGLEEFKQAINADVLPRGTVRVGLKAITDYILGNRSRGLRHDEPQKYVSRKRAGYKTSNKMRRFFFAVGILESDGKRGVTLNHYKRTGKTAAGYRAVSHGDWKYTIVNDDEGAYWTRHDRGQANMHRLAGRRKITAVIMDNMDGALRDAVNKINAFLKQKVGRG